MISCNFTSITGNLSTALALLGNTLLWKPAFSALLPTYALMQLLTEAGLPPGVINCLPGGGNETGSLVLASERSAHLETVSHLTTGIELLKTLPETPAHIQ